VLTIETPTRSISESEIRRVVASLVSIAAVGAFATRSEHLISWVFLAPTVAAFWQWALSRRRWSYLADLLGLWAPLCMNIVESNAEVGMFIAVFATAAMAGLGRQREYVHVMLAIFVFVMVILGTTNAINDFAWPNWLFGLVFAWGVGELTWRLIHTVDELEQTRSLVVDQATLNERRRIARDVHDLVGHSLTVVMLHVTGARHLVHKDPDEAERALLQAEGAAKESLAEIRRTVGMLRDESDSAAEILPAARLSDLSNLADEFLLAGVDVSLITHGPLDLVDPSVALAGYRIVQEAVTNVSRHAIGASATVSVVVDHEQCEITVSNDAGLPSGMSSGSGFGLASMRERARSVNGSLLAGPADGGWLVEASLPTRVDHIG